MEQLEDTIAELLEEEEEENPGWILTLADLMILLLVFFVLLYSMSTMSLNKFKRVLMSIQISLGETEPPIGILDLTGGQGILDKKVSIEDLTGIKSRHHTILKNIIRFVDRDRLGEFISVDARGDKIMIRIKGKVLFNSGAAELNPEGEPILDGIIEIIDEFFEYKVNIKGYTDNVPIATKQFPSNWELSAIRATTVLKYLIDGGIDPHRLTATGYGELLPLVPNDSSENRAQNRRVEFVLEKE